MLPVPEVHFPLQPPHVAMAQPRTWSSIGRPALRRKMRFRVSSAAGADSGRQASGMAVRHAGISGSLAGCFAHMQIARADVEHANKKQPSPGASSASVILRIAPSFCCLCLNRTCQCSDLSAGMKRRIVKPVEIKEREHIRLPCAVISGSAVSCAGCKQQSQSQSQRQC